MVEVSIVFKEGKSVIFSEDFDICVSFSNYVADVIVRSQDKEAVVGAFKFLLRQQEVKQSAFKPGLATASIWFPYESYGYIGRGSHVPSPFEDQILYDKCHELAVDLFKILKPDLAKIYFPEPNPPRVI